MTYDLLVHECMLSDIVGEGLPNANRSWVDLETGLDERHSRILKVELGTGGKWVVDTIHAEGLARPGDCASAHQSERSLKHIPPAKTRDGSSQRRGWD